MRLDLVGEEHLGNAVEVDERLRGRVHLCSLFSPKGDQPFSCTRSNESNCDMSDRITWSPGCSPSTTSMVFTDARPSFTLVAMASPSAPTLKIVTVLFSCPNAGRPT